jgi:hypothetical protein
MKAPKAVGLALVEKLRVPRGVVSSMLVKGEDPLSPDLKGFGVQCLGTYWVGPHMAQLLQSPATMTIARHPGSPRASRGVTRS